MSPRITVLVSLSGSLYERVKDGRITKKSLEERLRAKYSDLADLEDTAIEQGVPIYDVFEGDVIEGKLWPPSTPSK